MRTSVLSTVRYIVLLCFVTIFTFRSSAQSITTSDGRFEIGLGLGPSFFLGDLGGTRGVGKTFVKDVNFPLTKFMKGLYVSYYPSEWLGLLPKPVIAGELQGIKDYLSEEQKLQFAQPRFAEVKAGEAIFHHPLTLHGSGENKSDKPRRAFVINAFADGVRSDSDEPLLEGVPVVKKGDKMEGQFFPLLYSPQEN